MRERNAGSGFTLIETMVAIAVFSLLVVAIFQIIAIAQRTMRSEVARDEAEGTGTRWIDSLGRDVRESSYAYVYAGDWLATRDGAGAVAINVARNYFSASPASGGNALAPGISDESWLQCPNPACPWCNVGSSGASVPKIPYAHLARPSRNNGQAGSPTTPPPSFFSSDADARGRLFAHLVAGANCPFCNTALSTEAFFGGLLVFSPRRADRSYSYGGASGYEALWESMVFYCPFRDPGTGSYNVRRYVFYASSLAGGGQTPSLVNILDFNGNGIIESPPMVSQAGQFVLDAQGEAFHLQPGGGRNDLRYARWDSAAGRGFEILVNRATGAAAVTVTGGAFAGTTNLNLGFTQFGLGVSDFDVSTFINNPSWFVGAAQINPTGVVEPGVVRITFQVDRTGATRSSHGNLGQEESVQTTMLRPQN